MAPHYGSMNCTSCNAPMAVDGASGFRCTACRVFIRFFDLDLDKERLGDLRHGEQPWAPVQAMEPSSPGRS